MYLAEADRGRLIPLMRRLQARTTCQTLKRGKEPGETVKELYRKFFPKARRRQGAATAEQKGQVKNAFPKAEIEKPEEKLKRAKEKLAGLDKFLETR
ncbi:hypothetical protein [Desulfothermobacter acidiphilus]|uniref:hypothetical protein n=1 Tax=Desulfothermobacter acidiphilus TaxID=1938353 RepID=UPI003F8AB8F3